MSKGLEIHVVDNSDLIKDAAAEQIRTALEAVGIQAEGDVKRAMTDRAPRGARGLKWHYRLQAGDQRRSRPSRGAWVDDEQSKGAAKMAVWEQSKCDSEEQAFLIDGMTVEEFMKNCKKENEAEEKNNDETSNTR